MPTLQQLPPRQILGYFDFLCPTGFGNVSKNLVDRLIPWFKKNNIVLDIFPINLTVTTDYFWYEKNVVRVLNPAIFTKDTKDVYNRDGLLKCLKDGPYDLLWYINDVGVLAPMLDPQKPLLKMVHDGHFTNQVPKDFKVAAYMPVDSPAKKHLTQRFWQPGVTDWLQVISYTQYGVEQFQQSMPSPMPLTVIPHGTDKALIPQHKTYAQKIEQQQVARQLMNLPLDKIVIGNINANNHRKDIGCTLLSFKNLLNTLKDSGFDGEKELADKIVLYLHMAPTSKNTEGGNIIGMCNTLGLEINKTVFLRPATWDPKTPMQVVYTGIDIYVTTTTAEGWGLTVLEAMAAKLITCHPLHTSLAEIASPHNLCTWEPQMDAFFNFDGDLIRHLSNPAKVAETLAEALAIYVYIYAGLLKQQNMFSPDFWHSYNASISSLDTKAQELLNGAEENLKLIQNHALSYDWYAISLKWQQVFNKMLPKKGKIKTAPLMLPRRTNTGV